MHQFPQVAETEQAVPFGISSSLQTQAMAMPQTAGAPTRCCILVAVVQAHELLTVLVLQVSGYIDYAHRLKTDPNMEAYFGMGKRLMPRHTDLSFYNWETHLSTSNPTPNFQVCAAGIAPVMHIGRKLHAVVADTMYISMENSNMRAIAAGSLAHAIITATGATGTSCLGPVSNRPCMHPSSLLQPLLLKTCRS